MSTIQEIKEAIAANIDTFEIDTLRGKFRYVLDGNNSYSVKIDAEGKPIGSRNKTTETVIKQRLQSFPESVSIDRRVEARNPVKSNIRSVRDPDTGATFIQEKNLSSEAVSTPEEIDSKIEEERTRDLKNQKNVREAGRARRTNQIRDAFAASKAPETREMIELQRELDYNETAIQDRKRLGVELTSEDPLLVKREKLQRRKFDIEGGDRNKFASARPPVQEGFTANYQAESQRPIGLPDPSQETQPPKSNTRDAVIRTAEREQLAERTLARAEKGNPVPRRAMNARERQRTGQDFEKKIKRLKSLVASSEGKKLDEKQTRLLIQIKKHLANMERDQSILDKTLLTSGGSQLAVEAGGTPVLAETVGTTERIDRSEVQTKGQRPDVDQIKVDRAQIDARLAGEETDRVLGTGDSKQEIARKEAVRRRDQIAEELKRIPSNSSAEVFQKKRAELYAANQVVVRLGPGKESASQSRSGDAVRNQNRGQRKQSARDARRAEKGPVMRGGSGFAAREIVNRRYPDESVSISTRPSPDGPAIRADDEYRRLMEDQARPQIQETDRARRAEAMRREGTTGDLSFDPETGQRGSVPPGTETTPRPRSLGGVSGPTTSDPNRLSKGAFLKFAMASDENVADNEKKIDKLSRQIDKRINDKSVIGIVESAERGGVPSKTSAKLQKPLQRLYKLFLQEESLLRGLEVGDRPRSQEFDDRVAGAKPKGPKGAAATKRMAEFLKTRGLTGRNVPLILLSLLGIAGLAAAGSMGSRSMGGSERAA